MSAFGQSVENSIAHENDRRGNQQRAPYPHALALLVERLTLPTRPGWKVDLFDMDRGQGSRGLTLVILIEEPNTYRPAETIRVQHLMPVPPAAYDGRSWRRWLFEQIRLVDLHELMEGFVIDGERPYAPSHGPGNDPYIVRELGTDVDVRTSFRGVLKPIDGDAGGQANALALPDGSYLFPDNPDDAERMMREHDAEPASPVAFRAWAAACGITPTL